MMSRSTSSNDGAPGDEQSTNWQGSCSVAPRVAVLYTYTRHPGVVYASGVRYAPGLPFSDSRNAHRDGSTLWGFTQVNLSLPLSHSSSTVLRHHTFSHTLGSPIHPVPRLERLGHHADPKHVDLRRAPLLPHHRSRRHLRDDRLPRRLVPGYDRNHVQPRNLDRKPHAV